MVVERRTARETGSESETDTIRSAGETYSERLVLSAAAIAPAFPVMVFQRTVEIEALVRVATIIGAV